MFVTIVIIAIGVVLLLGIRAVLRRRAMLRSREYRPLAPLFFLHTSEAPPPPPIRPTPPTRGPPLASAPPPPPPAPYAPVSGSELVDDYPEAVEGKTVRFYRPMEGTLQFLPGRLEIAEGEDTGRDIRFVRTWGGEVPEITFGRSEGPPYRHVQLRAKTVSRNHARMHLEDERWKLTNLSATNPVLVNGQELGTNGNGRFLNDGDRIEMGEVVFRFHEH